MKWARDLEKARVGAAALGAREGCFGKATQWQRPDCSKEVSFEAEIWGKGIP